MGSNLREAFYGMEEVDGSSPFRSTQVNAASHRTCGVFFIDCVIACSTRDGSLDPFRQLHTAVPAPQKLADKYV